MNEAVVSVGRRVSERRVGRAHQQAHGWWAQPTLHLWFGGSAPEPTSCGGSAPSATNRPSRTNRSSTLAFSLALATVFSGSACQRTDQPASKGSTAKEVPSAAEPVKTELTYALVKTLDSGHEDLRGIGIDKNDHVYLAGKAGIRVLDQDGKLVREWATPKPAVCVAVRQDGVVFVCERTKVHKYDAGGKELGSWGTEGKERGQFQIVTSIAVDDVNVFVADAGSRCIHRFDDTGDFIDEIGKRDSESGFVGIVCPSAYLDCAVAADGTLYVGNPGQLRVEQYRIDDELLAHWGKPGVQPERFCGCCNPTNITLLPNGRVVTAEKAIPRVKVYDRAGKMLAYIGPDSFSPSAAGLDLAIDSKQRIHVIDPANGKVLVFAQTE